MRSRYDEELKNLHGALIDMGAMIESGDTEQIFSSPADKRTEDYITGRFG